MPSTAHIVSAPESAPHQVLRFAGRWIGWTGISVMLTFSSYCIASAYALQPVGTAESHEVGVTAVYTPSQWQLDELAVLER
jgi:hypothetical protein